MTNMNCHAIDRMEGHLKLHLTHASGCRFSRSFYSETKNKTKKTEKQRYATFQAIFMIISRQSVDASKDICWPLNEIKFKA